MTNFGARLYHAREHGFNNALHGRRQLEPYAEAKLQAEYDRGYAEGLAERAKR